MARKASDVSAADWRYQTHVKKWVFFNVCCYGFSQGWKSLYNTVVYMININTHPFSKTLQWEMYMKYIYMPFVFSSKRDTIWWENKRCTHFIFFFKLQRFWKRVNTYIYIYIYRYIYIACASSLTRDWLLTHMKQKRARYWTTKLRPSAWQSYARTLSASLFFYFFFDFFLSFEFVRQNYLCQINK